MEEYLEAYHDLFNLCERIKEIDKNYQLLLNKKLNRVEVHNFCQRGTSCVCVVDFLDARLIDKLKMTRAENATKFFRALDEENEALKIKQQNELVDKTRAVSEEIAKYSFFKNRDLTDEEFKKILNI